MPMFSRTAERSSGLNLEFLMDLRIGTWNVRGMGTSDKQKEVAKLIVEEKLHVCTVIETRLKSSKLVKACDAAFGSWNWISNIQHSRKGCRIAIGWNSDVVFLRNLHMTDQTMLCIIEIANSNTSCFVSFIYVENGGNDRRELWADLHRHKQIFNKNPWMLCGDFNVSHVQSIQLEDLV